MLSKSVSFLSFGQFMLLETQLGVIILDIWTFWTFHGPGFIHLDIWTFHGPGFVHATGQFAKLQIGTKWNTD